jgi:hypothetical protein
MIVPNKLQGPGFLQGGLPHIDCLPQRMPATANACHTELHTRSGERSAGDNFLAPAAVLLKHDVNHVVCCCCRCWEDWSDAQAATCPSCKQVTSEVPPQQHLVHTPPPPPTP